MVDLKVVVLFAMAIAFSAQSAIETELNAAVKPRDLSDIVLDTDHTFTIISSTAPSSQYEWDAIECLSEAYILHPNDIGAIISAFAELYKNKHSGTWNVNAGCTSFYTSKTNTVEIQIQVTAENGDVMVVSIYK